MRYISDGLAMAQLNESDTQSLTLTDIVGHSELSKQEKPRPQGFKKRLQSHDVDGSWIWEIGGAVLSVTCVCLLVAFLLRVNGMPYANWEHSIKPNTVIAILAAFSKTAMLVPVSTCLGQLKWKQNTSQSTPTQLYEFHLLDKASRGPGGALEVLWRMPLTLPMAGALLIVLSMALDPFSQQILTFPSHEVVASNTSNGSSFIQKSQTYYPRWIETSDSDQKSYKLTQVDPKMQIAILQGLTQTSDPLEPRCSSPRCRFNAFATLGICSDCVDVTNTSIQTCKPFEKGTEYDVLENLGPFASISVNCSYTGPSGLSLSPTLGTIRSNGSSFEHSRPSWTSVTSREHHSERPISIFAAQYSGEMFYSLDNKSMPENRPRLTECFLSLCEKQYPNISYTPSKNEVQEPSRSQVLLAPNPTLSSRRRLYPSGGAKTFSTNSNYTIDGSTWHTLVSLLRDIFNTTGVNYAAHGNMNTAPIAILANAAEGEIHILLSSMATSMTNVIRTSAHNDRVPGDAYTTETFVHVRWPWIIFPIILVLLSIVLLIITAFISRDQPVLWKSSIFPFLLGQLEIAPQHQITQLRHLDEIQSQSKKLKVSFLDKDGVLSFVELDDEEESLPEEQMHLSGSS